MKRNYSGKSDPVYIYLFLFLSTLFLPDMNLLAQHDSLRKYMELSVVNNPSIKQKFTEYRAALEKVGPAGALPDPQLNISYFLQPMELVNGRQLAEASIMQMFPWFGVLKNAKEEMKNMASSAYEEYRDRVLQLTYDVQASWYELYRIRKAVELTDKNIEILKGIEEIALIKYRSLPAGDDNSKVQTPRQSAAPSTGRVSSTMPGMAGGSQGSAPGVGSQQQQNMGMQQEQMGASSGSGLADLYRIRMEAADLGNSILSLRDQEQALLASFNILLDRDPATAVFTEDTLGVDSLTIPLTAEFDSFAGNPMVGMYEYEKKAYEAREKMNKGMGLPMVGFGLGYSLIGNAGQSMGDPSMNGSDMIMPMVSVTLPVWRKKYRSMRNEALLLAESASQGYSAASNNLYSEHYQAVLSYNDALRRIDLNKGQKVLASYTLDLLLTRFSVSSAGLTDILRVRQQLLDYDMRLLEAVTDYNKAVARLKRIMAVTPVELTPKND